jgi:hypothetical protein
MVIVKKGDLTVGYAMVRRAADYRSLALPRLMFLLAQLANRVGVSFRFSEHFNRTRLIESNTYILRKLRITLEYDM